MRPAAILAFFAVTTVATSARAGVGYNGVQMNGVQMNGVQMNGVQMNGVQMNGVQMNGVQMNGVSVSGLQIVGTELQGTIVDSNSWCSHSQLTTGAPLPFCSPCALVVEKSDLHCAWQAWDQTCVDEARQMCTVDKSLLAGATFTANVEADGQKSTRRLRLDRAPTLAPDPAPVWQKTANGWVDVNADVWLYNFSYWQPGKHPWQGSWQPICGNPDNAAIPVAGQWATCEGQKGCGGKTSNDGFTLGCDGIGAIAKCLNQFQYKPWKAVYETTPLGDRSHYQTLEQYHQACVRMVRGDYCGNGEPHTVDGTPIDVYDHLGVQTQTQSPPAWLFEAGWTPQGAACISVTRFRSMGGPSSPMPGQPNYPEAIQKCTEVSPVQWSPGGQIYIIDGCGNPWDFNPDANQTLPDGTNDWPRLWYYIGNANNNQ